MSVNEILDILARLRSERKNKSVVTQFGTTFGFLLTMVELVPK